MSRRLVPALGLVLLSLVVAACETTKSSNPLSPSVAGPIPGVNISAPKALEPTSGAKVAVDQQPLTLMVENASTSGVRPLNYLFEIATDADFNNKVFSRDGISPGDGRTTLRLPDKLAAERTYYWRARAQDGANTGPYSGASNFNVFTPIVIQAPTLVAPVGNVKVDSAHPKFTWANAPKSGPAGAITYVLEVSDTDSFANKIAIWTVGEQSNQTSLDAPQDLGFTKQYFWHVRAYDPTTTGPWSATQVFQTPDPPVIIAPPPPPGGGGDPGNTNGFSFGSVRVVGGSPDVSGWAVTSQVSSIRFGGGVFHIDHTMRGRWPAVAFGDTTQESTVWAFFNINGTWYGSGGERLRPGQTDKELGRPSDIGPGWFYNSLWSPMTNYVPRPGELVGFMVTAGDTRAGANISVRERTNVVFISFPSDAGGSYPPFASTAGLGFIRW